MARVFRMNNNMTIMLIICLQYLPIFLISSGVCRAAVPASSSASCAAARRLATRCWGAVSAAVSPARDTRDSWRRCTMMIYCNQSLICSLDSRKICYCPCWGCATSGSCSGRGRRSGIARPPQFDLGPPLLPPRRWFHLTTLIADERRKRKKINHSLGFWGKLMTYTNFRRSFDHCRVPIFHFFDQFSRLLLRN